MADLHCPNCGTSLGASLRGIRMMNCPSCGTSVFVEDEALRVAGHAGVMHDVPSLIAVGQRVAARGRAWRTIGQVRFAYGRGTWDEFWALDDDGGGVWISVDEGDVVVQQAVRGPERAAAPVLGETVSLPNGAEYRVTEAETATCEALRGALPEPMAVGETHRFVNATSGRGDLLSGEFWDGGSAWYLGEWLDPFEIRATPA